jgi:transposase
MLQATIGVDVSKDRLDAHRLPDGMARRFPNSASGHRALIGWIAEAPVERVAFEPTGAYHRALEQALAKAGVAAVKVNPLQARRFAEAIGQRAKTDPVDALMLARMVALLEPELREPTSKALHELRELQGARHALVKDRTAARNRQKNLTLDLLKRQAARRLKQIDAQLEAVDREIRRRIAEDEALARRFAILCSIPGIGETTAFVLLIDMPELGALEPKQAASLAGLAPLARQSGTWTGHACIRGGRAKLRQALFMPALVALRFNPDLQDVYRRLVQAGKPPKLAIVAVMRKLVLLANALLRSNRTWTQKLA